MSYHLNLSIISSKLGLNSGHFQWFPDSSTLHFGTVIYAHF